MLREGQERTCRRVGAENLCASPFVFGPAFHVVFPFDVAVHCGESVVFAFIFVYLWRPYYARAPVVGGQGEHLLGSVPLFEVFAAVHLYASRLLAVGVFRVVCAVEIIG